MTALVWFRRDLRVGDHPALRAALERHDRVVPVFCFDERLLAGRHRSGPRTQFLLECLEDLDDPDGAYVRRYVPELAPVPDEYLREPWRMPAELQRGVGCVMGEHYPEPIVDHAEARRAALDRYRVG